MLMFIYLAAFSSMIFSMDKMLVEPQLAIDKQVCAEENLVVALNAADRSLGDDLQLRQHLLTIDLLHIQKILRSMLTLYLAQRSITSPTELLIVTKKYLEKLTPRAREFILSRFINNYGYPGYSRKSGTIACDAVNSEKENSYTESSSAQLYQSGKSPDRIVFGGFRGFDFQLRTMRGKTHSHAILPSSINDELYVLFVQKEMGDKVEWDDAYTSTNQVLKSTYLYVFMKLKDKMGTLYIKLFERKFTQGWDVYLLELNLNDAQLSPDESMLFIIVTYGYIVFKLNPFSTIIESEFNNNPNDSCDYHIAGAFSPDSMQFFVMSYDKTKRGGFDDYTRPSKIKVEIYDTQTGKHLHTLFSAHTIKPTKDDKIKMRIYHEHSKIVLTENDKVTAWAHVLSLPQLFFVQSIFKNKSKARAFFSVDRVFDAFERTRDVLFDKSKIMHNQKKRILDHLAHTVAVCEIDPLKQKPTIADTVLENGVRRSDSTYYCALAIDGEGAHSLMSSALLAQIETETGSSIASLFDVVTGSSFGALLGLFLVASDDGTSTLSTPKKYSESLHAEINSIFGKKSTTIPYYASDYLKRFLEVRFARTRLSNTTNRFVLPCIRQLVGNKILQPFAYDTLDAQRDARFDELLKTIVLHATAYSPFFDLCTKDNQQTYASGLYHNNSAQFLYDRILSKDADSLAQKKVMLLSVGCGYTGESIVLTHEKMRESLGLNYAKIDSTDPLITNNPPR